MVQIKIFCNIAQAFLAKLKVDHAEAVDVPDLERVKVRIGKEKVSLELSPCLGST